MTVWIIEDEPPALRRLTKLLEAARPGLHIAFSGDSIATCARALKTLPQPDVIFSDIHLADGLAFQLWENHPTTCPIVFTTAYDQYSLRAFRVNSVDYLLKPINPEELERALGKVAERRPVLSPDWSQIATLIHQREPAYRERYLARKGQEWLPVRVADLRQFYSVNGLTFALTATGQRVLLDDTLDRISEEVDPRRWFRINRGQIVHIDAVTKMTPYFNHRLVLELKPKGEGENLVSRARVKEFKRWVGH